MTPGAAASIAVLLGEAAARLEAAGVDSPRTNAEALLAHVLGARRLDLLVRAAEPLGGEAIARYHALVDRRCDRIPLHHLLGEREFWSLPFRVGAGVLSPRPETEVLVEEALRRARETGKPSPRIADLGTGSGAIAVVLAREIPGATLWAVDASPEALAVAAENARRHGTADRVRLLLGDLFAPLPAQARPLDGIVSNPPYIPSAMIPFLMPEVRDHEPRGAYDGGEDGLALIRRIFGETPGVLAQGGWLALEFGALQEEALRGFAGQGPWRDVRIRKDYAGYPRVFTALRA